MSNINLLRVTVREFRANLKEYCDSTKKESIIITKNNDDYVLIKYVGEDETNDN